MEIPLFVLVLQIGFIAALNNRVYRSNPVMPSPRFVNSGQTRRLPEIDSFMQLSSRGIPESDEQSDSEYSNSSEEFSYRSVRPLQSRSNQRRNDYLRYSTRPENDVSLEAVPIGRINSDNYAERFQPYSYLSRRTDPYFRNGPSNIRPSETRQYYRKANDDLSLEVSSLESSNPKDAYRLGVEDTYLRSLFSLIEQENNRRGQNRKYNRQGNSLSIDVSPIDKLEHNEDAHYSLSNSLNKRRYNNQNAYTDTILLVSDDDQLDEIPKSGSSQPTGLGLDTLYNRRYDDGLNPDEDFYNHLSPIRGLKPRLRGQQLTNDNPLTRKYNRKSNNNAGVKSPLNDELSLDDENTEKLTVLRLANLEDLNLESPIQRSDNNRKKNHRNFLRLSLSPENKLTLDEGVASDLSEILSETLDELNLAPANLRRTDLPNNKNSRRENNRLSAEEDNLSNLSLLRLGSLDNRRHSELVNRSSNRNLRTHRNHTRQAPKKLSTFRSYRKPASRSSNRNLRTHGNHTRQDLKKLFDEDTAKNLVPYHEGKSIKLLYNRTNENQNNNSRDDGFSDEFSLDTLFAYKKEGNFSSDLTARSTSQDNLSLETPLPSSSDDILSKDTSDTLHLEFPWNDQLSPDDDKGGTLLRSNDKRDNTKDTTDTLNLEFPWNGALSPHGDKGKSHLRTDKKTDNSKDHSDTLDLEFPWNGALSPGGDKGKSQLRTDDETDNAKDNSDTLDLEFPWNGALSPEGDKGKSQLRTDDKTDSTKDNSDTLDLEFPWNGALSPDGDKVKSLLRTDNRTDNTKYNSDILDLEFPWNDALSPDSHNSKSQLRSKDSTKDTMDSLHLEFPWNDQLSPDESKTRGLLRRQEDSRQDKETKDELKLDFPWNEKTSPDKPSSKKTTLRIPDPLFIHPYIRSRNLNKHPNYFKRSYDEFSESHRLKNLRERPSKRRRQSKRRRYDNLNVRGLASSSGEDPSDWITFPEDSPPLVTTTSRPNYSQLLLKRAGGKRDRQTYNDTIIFPND